MVDVGGQMTTVGALAQANYGSHGSLRLDGQPIGERISADVAPVPVDQRTDDAGSIIVIVATDAPLLADQCQRLARRATVSLARVGGNGANGSGDLFLAFSTQNRVDPNGTQAVSVDTLPETAMTPLFEAVAEAVEESIWNALVAADTTTGHLGRTVHAIPHDLLLAAYSAS